MFELVQILGLVSTFCTCVSFFQREKWKMMLWLSATNAILVTTYILCGRLLGGLLCVGALVRTIVYFFFNKANKKPNVVVLLAFEIYYVVMSVVMWSSAVDLIMLANLVVVTYTTWQDNVNFLRWGYVISAFLLIPYDILIGAYTTVFSEVAMLVSVVISLIKYRKTKSKPKSQLFENNIDQINKTE